MKASTQFAILSLTLFGPTCGVFAQMPGPGGAMPMPVSALQPNGYAAMNPSGSAAVVAPQPIPMLDVRHSAAEGVYPPGGPYPGYELSQPFGPQINFEGVLERGNGWANNFYRGSAFVPHHIDPWTSLLLFDLAASGTDDGDGVYNFGVIYREYVESLQRVFGLNAYYDFDYGHQRERYQQFGFGIESLGKYCDFRANGYIVDGPDDYIISNQLLGDCTQAGHGFLFSRNELLESALTGGEIEAGGPLPFLGRYGLNFFAGGYYLDAENTDEAIGLKLRGEVLLTQSLTVNVLHSNDDVIGKNTWVNVAVSFPGWRNRRFLRNRPTVRERLGDRVIRDNRVHTVIATRTVTEEATNPDTNLAYNIFYVNPNSMLPGDGTVERPLGSLQMLANMNNAGIDIIRVDRRLDDTGTNLTVDGGLDLFDNQQLLSGTKSFNFQSVQGAVCQLPATNTGMTIPPLGPLISNPTLITNVAGVPINPLSDSRASVIRLADNNTVSGFRIDASDVTNSHFGIGIVNLAPITDFEITCNTFLNYADAFADTGSGGSGGAVVLSNVSGSGLTGIFDDNTMNGMAGGMSANGMLLTTAPGSTLHLSVQRNVATNHDPNGDGLGFGIAATPGSTIHANNPAAFSAVVGMTVPSTGIIGNTATGNGTGMVNNANIGATFNAVVDGNDFSTNTIDGFRGTSDGGMFNLQSFAGNTSNNNGFLNGIANGASSGGLLLHYLNGGAFRSVSEDTDWDLNLNGLVDVGEAIGGNGLLDLSEDLNGNGRLDHGFVSNTSSGNSSTGLCIIGEDTGTGIFDIGGPDTALGNTFNSNRDTGIGVDLSGSATAQITAVNNTITGSPSTVGQGLTFVLDFWEAGQGGLTDPFGQVIDPFDVTAFGFAPTEFDLVTTAVLDTVRGHYHNIPTTDVNAMSPIPAGQQLDVDFVIGNLGEAPSNGAAEFYTIVVGDTPTASAPLGIAFLSAARDATGAGPNFGTINGAHIGSIYSNNINGLGGLTPSDFVEPPGTHADLPATDELIADALTSGNLTFTRNALGGTTSHEVGHNVSLLHLNLAGSVTPNGFPPIMGTGSIDTPNQARIGPREFAFSGTNDEAGGAMQMHIQQLVDALGLRAAVSTGVSGDGIRIRGSDMSSLPQAVFINNTISGNGGTGLGIELSDAATAPDVRIQGHSNSITNNGGHGIFLEADGMGALIDTTIGGLGTNMLRGMPFTQGNTITGNGRDGIRLISANNGIVQGSILGNNISSNNGDGIAMLIDPATIDLFDMAAGRRIHGNTISGNAGFGIHGESSVLPGEENILRARITGNVISDNPLGGVFIRQTGVNNPPTPPVIPDNNMLDLHVGGATPDLGNVINNNGDAGVALIADGTSKAITLIQHNTITNTMDGPNPDLDGDGIYIQRSGSSLILAEVLNNTATGNADNGLHTVAIGSDHTDPNQPMTGMPTSVEWNLNNFSNNGGDGAFFRVFGKAVLLADGAQNVLSGNAGFGFNATTSESAAFGDPTDTTFPMPGRRVVLNNNTVTNNMMHGMLFSATEESFMLAEVNSTLGPAGGGPGAHGPPIGGPPSGGTLISDNGIDGIHIGGSTSGLTDIVIDGGGFGMSIDNNGDDGVGIEVFGETTVEIRDGVLIQDNGDNGVEINVEGVLTTQIDVGVAGGGNIIRNNGNDGVQINVTDDSNSVNPLLLPLIVPLSATPDPTINVTDNIIGGTLNGVPSGNAGDGVNIRFNGGVDDDLLPDAAAVGPVGEITVAGNAISYNGERGIDFEAVGAGGIRNNGFLPPDPRVITVTGNQILSNAQDGILAIFDLDYHMNREVELFNTGFMDDNRQPGFDATGMVNADGSQAFFHPGLAVFTGLPDYLEPYLNLRTQQNTVFTVTDNSIQNNGTGTMTGVGAGIFVGTGVYVAGDVSDNSFGGNLEDDFVTGSFLSAGDTLPFVDNADDTATMPATPVPDLLYLDDSAQLDLRFAGNTGNQIDPQTNGPLTTTGAFFTNLDLAKVFPNSDTFFPIGTNVPAIGPEGFTRRETDIFQVDNGFALDAPNNSFITLGTPQTLSGIPGAFFIGGYSLHAGTDPLYPNPAFPPPIP